MPEVRCNDFYNMRDVLLWNIDFGNKKPSKKLTEYYRRGTAL